MRARLIALVGAVCALGSHVHAAETAPPVPTVGRYRPFLDMDETRCVTAEDRERAARAANPQAFSSDVGIYLPPLYWASKDRTFEQIALTYWKNVDVEDATRFDLLFPLFARLCTPENDTTVAPFGLAGWKTDERGTAGYVGPYFFRRDAQEETDTLFPVFWWIRDDAGATLIAGPWFDVDTPKWRAFGLAPLYFAYEGQDRFFETLLPLYVRVGSDDSESGLALQTFWSRGPRKWSALSFPFYAGGRDDDARRSWDVVPPLLFAAWADGDESGFVAGPYVNLDSPRSHDRAFVPVFAFGDGVDAAKSPLASLLLDDSLFAPDGSPGARAPDAPFHYHLVPPLLYAHAGDGTFERTWFLQSYLQRSSQGWDAGVLPLWLGGRTTNDADDGLAYDIVPPLLFARWSERGEDNLWLAQTWGTWRDADEWSLASVPFVWAGQDGERHHLVLPPLAFAAWGGPSNDGGVEESLLVGPWLDTDRTGPDGAPAGHDTAILPFGFAGRVDAGGEAAWMTRPLAPALAALLGRGPGETAPFHHVLVPPLLLAHVSDDVTQRTWVLQSYFASSPSGWDAGSLPLYMGGRETQDPEGGLAYDVVPPLLLAHWSEDGENSLWFAQTFAQWSAQGWWFMSLPIAAGGGDEDSHFALAPPLLFADVGFKDVRVTHFASAWLWSWQHTWHGGVFPLYAGGRGDEQGSGFAYDLAPAVLFARWRNSKDENVLWLAQTVATWDPARWSVASVPFFFGAKEPDGRHHLVVPPLLFGRWGNGVDEENLLAGPWLDLARPGGREQWVAPLFMEGHAHLADWNDDADVSTWGTGLTRVLRPTLQATLGKAASSTEPLHVRVVPPLLYAHVGDGDTERTWFVQSYLARSKEGWDAGSLPFYVGGRGPDGAYDVIPPLLFARAATDDAWWFAAAPFALGGGDESGAHHLVIPPLLLAVFGDTVDETVVAGPWIDVDAPGGHDTALLPLYFGGEAHLPGASATPVSAPVGPERAWGAWLSRTMRPTLQAALGRPLSSTAPLHHRFVPPLLYGHVGGVTESGATERTWFLQSYFARSDAGWDFGTAPLYFGGRETQGGAGTGLSYDIVPPLLFALWGDDGERSLWFAQTLAHWDADAWWLASLPFAFAGGDALGHHLVIPPLLFAQWGDGARAGGSENLWAAQTLAHWDASSWWLASVPFVFAGARDPAHHLVIPPLLFAQWGDGARAGGSENLWAAQTLAHWDASSWWLASVPFVFAGARDPAHHLVIPPLLFAHWGDGTDERTVVGPWFDMSGPRGAHRGLVPLYFGGREGGPDPFEYDLVPPLLLARGADGDGSWLWFAQTFARWNETTYDVSSVPLLFAGNDGAGRHHLVIPPLVFGAWGDERRGIDNLVVGPYVDLKAPGGHDRALVPFFFEGETTTYSGGPLAQFVGLEALHGPLDSTRPAHYRVVPFVYAHMGNGVTEQTVFLQSWLRRSPWGVDAGSFPLWLGGWTARDDGPSYQVVPPLLFATWSDGKGTRDVIAGPVWHTARPRGWSTWALPFYLGADGDRGRRPYYHVVPPLLFAAWGDTFKETRTTLQFPFYLRHEDRKGFIDAKTPLWLTWGNDTDWRSLFLPLPLYASHVDGEDWLLAPLVYRRDDKVTSDLVVFPFLWDFRGPDLDATVVSGVWWDFHWKKDRERLQIAPGYLRWDDPTETLTIAGPLAWSNAKDSAASSFHVFPLYSQWSFHPEHLKWRVLFGALGYERERDVEQWMVFWIKTKPE